MNVCFWIGFGKKKSSAAEMQGIITSITNNKLLSNES